MGRKKKVIDISSFPSFSPVECCNGTLSKTLDDIFPIFYLTHFILSQRRQNIINTILKNNRPRKYSCVHLSTICHVTWILDLIRNSFNYTQLPRNKSNLFNCINSKSHIFNRSWKIVCIRTRWYRPVWDHYKNNPHMSQTCNNNFYTWPKHFKYDKYKKL